MSALSRSEAAPSSVSELRLLPRATGEAGGRGIGQILTSSNPHFLKFPNAPFQSMIWIAVDAMGGDAAPSQIVDGAVAATRHFDLGVALVGPTNVTTAELGRHTNADRRRIRVLEAGTHVEMREAPSAALRRKPNSPI